jgi:hypothetical protein
LRAKRFLASFAAFLGALCGRALPSEANIFTAKVAKGSRRAQRKATWNNY